MGEMRKGILKFRCLVFGLLFFTVQFVHAQAAAQSTPYGVISVTVNGSRLCVGVGGGSVSALANVDAGECMNLASQQWSLVKSDQHFQIVAKNSQQCLTILNASTSPGERLVQYPCNNGSNQQWDVTPSGTGHKLVSVHDALCVSVDSASHVIQDRCSSSESQILHVSAPPEVTGSLIGMNSNLCVDSGDVGVQATQNACSNVASQQWRIRPTVNGYKIRLNAKDLCLGVRGASQSAGAAIEGQRCDSGTNQLWTIRAASAVNGTNAYSNGYWQFVSASSGQCIVVQNASTAAQANLIQSPCNGGGGSNTMWRVNRTLPSSWGGPITLPLVPTAAAHLPDGKILMWSADLPDYAGGTGGVDGNTQTTVFDPIAQKASDAVLTSVAHNMFCPGLGLLPSGKVFVNGGVSSRKTSIYDPVTHTWGKSDLMNIPRGYEASATLSDGSVFTLGGSWNIATPNFTLGDKYGEVWTPGGGWSILSNVPDIIGPDPAGAYRGDNHMWLVAAQNRWVFYAGPDATLRWIDTKGAGQVVPVGQRGDDGFSINGNAVMYDIGKLLTLGGAPAYDGGVAKAGAYVIDISAGPSAVPVVRKVQPLAYSRGFVNSVVLPNGQVVVIGGQAVPVPFTDDQSVLVPELWDPTTEAFTRLAPMSVPRNYHSEALLLPDGRVMSSGGGLCGSSCNTNHPNVQILTPPYLLNADGSNATRPAIKTSPASAAYGATIAVSADMPIRSFALVRMSSSTHSVNTDQRRIPLVAQQTSASGDYTYSLSIPSDSGVAIPGNYMLFAMNASGVPSVAKIIQIGA
ncbi:RICIN domain-containing protein [Burkholderia sp. RF4-BP95]|uniref:RICIN domain-containing protein n=1 Tax=Burkholderia sp. RF4-BP95 TaxID=1637845 RepID=UPI0007534FC2|nr:RICIN domain-containing protein [Burkholderia sp. RF4-BP95]KUY84079.1 galactose oxidase [Burkholderia sp. RF4-BP95]